MIWHLTVVIFLGRQFDTAPFLEKTILQCSEDNLPVVIFLRRQLSTALFLEKTIVHCTEDNCPLLRRQLYRAKKSIWKCSFLEKTILPKKTILPPLSDCTVHISQLFFTDRRSGRGNQRFKGYYWHIVCKRNHKTFTRWLFFCESNS